MAIGGDVFVLDMGKPVKIADLARRMIHLSGLTVADENNPDGDIEIQYTGLRPAEKLYEELLIGSNVVRHRTSDDHARPGAMPVVGARSSRCCRICRQEMDQLDVPATLGILARRGRTNTSRPRGRRTWSGPARNRSARSRRQGDEP